MKSRHGVIVMRIARNAKALAHKKVFPPEQTAFFAKIRNKIAFPADLVYCARP
jgi:hypothetical protein